MADVCKRLLVVDDEQDFCDFVRRVAEGMDYCVRTLTDSSKFQTSYNDVQPDVVILDMVMPDQDGFEVIDWMVENECGARVVLVTGYNPHYAKSAQIQAAARGIFQVKSFTKPISVRKLRAALD